MNTLIKVFYSLFAIAALALLSIFFKSVSMALNIAFANQWIFAILGIMLASIISFLIITSVILDSIKENAKE